jgi:hypothetical protein
MKVTRKTVVTIEMSDTELDNFVTHLEGDFSWCDTGHEEYWSKLFNILTDVEADV